MPEPFDFEAQLEARLRAHAQPAARPFDAAGIAARVAATPRRTPWSIMDRGRAQPSRALLLVGVTLVLVATVIGAAVLAGGRPSTPLPAVVTNSPAPSAMPASPAASAFPVRPGEPWIAFMDAIAGADSDRIWLVRPDGSDRHQLLTGLDGQQEHPDWSPDGTHIAFDHWYTDPARPGQQLVDLWVMDADGSHPTRVASCAAPCQQLAYPSWSPDGTKLVLVRFDDQDGPSALETLDLASGARRTLSTTTDGRTAYHNPRWSPDGTEIALTIETYQDAAETVFVGSAVAVVRSDGSDGQQPRVVTPADLEAAEPDWNPVDGRIAFRTHFDPGDPKTRPTSTEIDVMQPDGSGLTTLSHLGLGDLRAIQPSWTPDGSQIVFTQIDGFGGSQIPAIAVMDADGTNVTRLGFSAGTAGRMRPVR